MATYVIGDIHNSIKKLDKMIKLISPTTKDQIIILGDIFDRGGAGPDPVGVYFRICGLNTNVKWIRGNHDQLLAEYIYSYYGNVQKKRSSLQPYRYNSFELMKDRFVEVDMLNLADLIMGLPLQIEIEISSVKYLLAHAMTFDPTHGVQEETLYLEGIEEMQEYWEHGVKGYVSLVGHHDSSYQHSNPKGRYLDEESSSIWLNEQENVYMIDCGCGLPNGRLASICLETERDFTRKKVIFIATYVISDIHGQYDMFMELLDKIKLKKTDTLYVLGDVLDRGPHPIKTLRKLMKMPNAICMVGNHELMALECLEFLMKEITDMSIEELDEEMLDNLVAWKYNGSKSTINEFSQLDSETKQDVIDFIKEFLIYEEVSINDKDYLLVHAGL